jgi:transmembrane sensor
MSAADSKPLDASVIREAARWLVRLHSGEVGPADHLAFERWRHGNPERERAWQRAQLLIQQFDAVPSSVGVPLLTRPSPINRRTVLRTLAVLGLTVPSAALLAYRMNALPAAAYSTAVGESQDLVLADGSQVHLNTDTAMDVRYSDQTRLLYLRGGEVYVRTAADRAGRTRPFIVATPQGRMRALGTRFVVRHLDGGEGLTELTVLEHRVAVNLDNGGPERIFNAGESVRFTANALQSAVPSRSGEPGWTRGVIEADNMRLDTLLAEVARYRRGVVRCDPAVGGLLVSGVFRLQDTDALLAIVAKTLDLRVVARTSYWVTLTR